MSVVFIKDSRPIHHACVFAGERDAVRTTILDTLESELAIRATGNPDFSLLETDVFAIAESRELREQASMRAVGEKGRYFLIAFDEALAPAQNALLKLLEEPPPDTYFLIIVPSFGILLPTVRSRLFEVRTEGGRASADTDTEKRVHSFLKSTVPKRLKQIEPMIKRAQEDDTKPEALREARAFVRLITETLRQNPAEAESAARTLDYLHDRSPSIKMLLEYLALTAPRK